MNPKILKNFEENLRIESRSLLQDLDFNIDRMFAEHARDGKLRSGSTIKCGMDYVAEASSNLFKLSIDFVSKGFPSLTSDSEQVISGTVSRVHNTLLKKALEQFRKCCKVSGKPDLYDRMLPELETQIAAGKARFLNELNLAIVESGLQKEVPLFDKASWIVELLLTIISIFIAGMWFANPEGNYEPLLVVLALVITLNGIIIKLRWSKST